MGQSIAGQLNQLPINMNGNVLGPNGADGDTTMNLTPPGGSQPGFGMPGGDATATTQQQAEQMQIGGMPGMGGKGGMPMPGDSAPGMGGKSGGPLAQIPIGMDGNVLGADQPPAPISEPTSMPGLPPAPIAPAPLAKTSGGTIGRPSPSAPMVPRGVGFNNPGAPGAPPQQPPQRGILTNPQGQNMPFQGGMQNRLQPAKPAPVVRPVNPYRPTPTFARPVNVARRGAGRGGVLR